MANCEQLFLSSEKLLALLCIIESIYINILNAIDNQKSAIILPVMFFTLISYIGPRLIYVESQETKKIQIRKYGSIYFMCFYIWYFVYSIYADIYLLFNQYQKCIGIWLFIIKFLILIFMLVFIVCIKEQASENRNLYVPLFSIILLIILIVDFTFYRAQNHVVNTLELLLYIILFFCIKEKQL